MDNLQLTRLKDLAEKATPGEWCASVDYDYEDDCLVTIITTPKRQAHSMLGIATLKYTDGWEPQDYFAQEQCANAAFMLAANPQTVLALIAEIERLEKENTALKSDLHMAKDMGYLQGIRAGITAGRAQCQTRK